MKKGTKILINLGIDIAMLGAYWLCEAIWFRWLYAIAPVAIVVGFISVIALIWGLSAKKPWLVVTLPGISLFSIALLAVVSMLLKGKPLL